MGSRPRLIEAEHPNKSTGLSRRPVAHTRKTAIYTRLVRSRHSRLTPRARCVESNISEGEHSSMSVFPHLPARGDPLREVTAVERIAAVAGEKGAVDCPRGSSSVESFLV